MLFSDSIAENIHMQTTILRQLFISYERYKIKTDNFYNAYEETITVLIL